MKTNFLNTKEDIRAWLDKYEVKNYTLIEDATYGFVVNVEGSVVLNSKQLTSIEVKFNEIRGSFYCQFNRLTSLEFAPTKTSGDFWCSDNNLTSLKFCPQTIGGDFYCSHNELTSLEFCPTKVGNTFACGRNQITSLQFCPISVGGSFLCNDNQLTSLEFCPAHIGGGGDFYCGNNPALGNTQAIKDFAEILSLHQEIVRIKQEKADIGKELGKVSKTECLSNKSILKI